MTPTTIERTTLTLYEAIEQLVNLGERDPIEIAEKIKTRNDRRWLRDQLEALADDIIADGARRQLGSVRRKLELALRPGDQLSSSEFRIAKAWVPGSGYKVAGDLTRDDLLARAAWYETFADASVRRATWCRDVVSLMDAEGVLTLGALKATLPELPAADDVAGVLAA